MIAHFRSSVGIEVDQAVVRNKAKCCANFFVQLAELGQKGLERIFHLRIVIRLAVTGCFACHHPLVPLNCTLEMSIQRLRVRNECFDKGYSGNHKNYKPALRAGSYEKKLLRK